MDSREIIRALIEAGWFEDRQRGSHKTFKHVDVANVVTVQHPRKDVPLGTLKKIERQSGLRMR